MDKKLETATFACGCFWCYQPIFQSLKGVEEVVVGYAGGDEENPTYDEVAYGETSHAESYQIKFDPEVISFRQLLEVYYAMHDPTTKDRQGNDIGPSYRSILFYHNEKQKEEIEGIIKELTDEKAFDKPIVTEVKPYTNFYPAEDDHQNYYEKHPGAGYCQVVINPKMTKFKAKFKELMKNPSDE